MLKNIKFIFGLVVVIGILLANISFYFNGIDSIKSGPPNIPPYSKTLQFLTKSDIFSISEHVDDWSSFFDSNEIAEDEEAEDNISINRPDLRGIIGGSYTYNIKSKNIEIDYIELINGPSEMTIDGRLISWLPNVYDVGVHRIEILINQSHKLTYNLYVSKHKHLLGTNIRGDDVFDLLVAGSVWVLFPASITIFFGVILGVFLGAMSGFYEGIWTKILNFILTIVETVPGLLIIFLVAVISRFNIYIIFIGIGLVLLPVNARMIRNIVQNFVKLQFVEASREIGFSNKEILWRDIIYYNCNSTIVRQIFNCLVFAIVTEITISYLGLGIKLPDISWGELLRQGRNRLIYSEFWLFLSSGLVIILTIVGFNSLGQAISSYLNKNN